MRTWPTLRKSSKINEIGASLDLDCGLDLENSLAMVTLKFTWKYSKFDNMRTWLALRKSSKMNEIGASLNLEWTRFRKQSGGGNAQINIKIIETWQHAHLTSIEEKLQKMNELGASLDLDCGLDLESSLAMVTLKL